MSSTPREHNLVDRILKYVNGLNNCKCIKIHGDEYTETGTPDLFAVVYGLPVLIEVKRKGEEPTAIQYARLRQWKRAGAIVTWVDNFKAVQDLIAKIDAVRTYDDLRTQGVEL